MRHPTPWLCRLVLTACVMLAHHHVALAQQNPASTIKPLVVFLLDTSGSMEYEAGNALNVTEEFSVPLCESPSASGPSMFAAGNYPKSRLIVAKEVLTGTFRDYWCRYDYRDDDPNAVDFEYPVPHIQACGGTSTTACEQPEQDFDGLLDQYRDFIRFGFMTFDSRESNDSSEGGMWSYGPDATGAAGVNLGVKNDAWGNPNIPNQWDATSYSWTYSDSDRSVNNVGQLIAPPLPDNETFQALRQVNRELQYEVNSVEGYWGTPLAPMLEDAEYFLRNHASVVTTAVDAANGDPFSNCRDRIVILITDGRASMGEGLGGYSTTIEALEKLKTVPPAVTAPKVYVVGYNLADEDASLLDEVEEYADGAFTADTATGLRQALSEIFALTQADIQSRTPVVYTNATQSSVDAQYQFNAAFQADPDNPTNIVGYLNQTLYRCSSDCLAVSADGASCPMGLVQIHEKLNSRVNSGRTLYVAVDGQREDLKHSLADLAGSGEDMESMFAINQTGQLPTIEPASFSGNTPIFSQDPLGPASDLSVQRTYLKQLVSLIRADSTSARRGKQMGGVVHTAPVVQEPARHGQYPSDSWGTYIETVQGGTNGYPPKCRPTVLFAGTHDGLIHAFRVDRFDDGDSECADYVDTQSANDVGEELWAIMPQRLLKASQSLVGGFAFLMDGQMRLADVMLTRSNPAETTTEQEAAQWRSVLVAGYGAGGQGFIGLDVTTALSGPEVMWEIDHEARCHAGTCHLAADGNSVNDFSKLGLTKGQPAFGTAFIDQKEVAIALLPGGDALGVGGTNPEAGRVVYVVRLDNGEKVAEFSNTSGNIRSLSGGSTTLTHHFASTPAIYSNVPGVVSSRAFLGDTGGRLWRIDLSAPNPSDWSMTMFYDPYVQGPLDAKEDAATGTDQREPVLGAPALALDSSDGNLAIVFGNGNLDSVSGGGGSRTGVFSVSEVVSGGSTIGRKVNWETVHESNERMTGDPLVFNKVAYYTTYLADTTDACAIGTGRIYGVNYKQASGMTPLAGLDQDGDPSTVGDVSYVSTGESVPFGVQVIQRPTCQPGQGETPDALGQKASNANGMAQGDLELAVNVAKGSDFGSNTVPPNTNGSDLPTKTITRALSESGEMIQGGTWGYVLY